MSSAEAAAAPKAARTLTGRVVSNKMDKTIAVAIERLHPDLRVAPHLAAEVRDREAALIVLEALVGDRREHGVHEDRQRDVGLVGVARVVLDLDRADPQRRVHLHRGEARAGGVVHGLHQVVDEALDRGRAELVVADGPGRLAEDGVTDLGDFEDGHGERMPEKARGGPSARPPPASRARRPSSRGRRGP